MNVSFESKADEWKEKKFKNQPFINVKGLTFLSTLFTY